MVKIDKQVPMPMGKSGRSSHELYPWADLKVGDSFATRYTGISTFGWAKKLAQLKTGFTFAARTMPDKTVRIWRIK